MTDFRDEEKINALRERLYSRGQQIEKDETYSIKKEPKPVPTSWQKPPQAVVKTTNSPATQNESAKSVLLKKAKELQDRIRPKQTVASTPEQTSYTEETQPVTEVAAEEDMAPKKKRGYRKIILLAGLGFFVLSMIFSSIFFFFGGNNISGENIAIDINGPFTIGGGETIPLQIAVTNQNTVAIESATLIVNYPPNTQSATEKGKNLNTERLSLETVNPGETLNVPLRAVVFGEEDSELTITAEIEYRVQGSNSTFARQADPLRVKIGSSPVSISVSDTKKLSSGQETEITVTVKSNAQNTLSNVLVRAEYPVGFDFTSSEPQPVSGQNVWQIDTIEPGEEATITLKGAVVGQETDAYSILYSVGVGSQSNPLSLTSIFATAETAFEIEQPFIGIELEINRQSTESVAVEAGETVDVDISLTNTLNAAIYDAVIELAISGNALSDYEVDANRGFYDSRNNLVRFASADIEALKEILPGRTVNFSVQLLPDPDIERTPQLAFEVDAKARRVREGGVAEELVGTAAAVAKVTSVATLLSEVARGTSVFTERGPLPPVAEEETTYTVSFLAENGSNDISGVEVTTSLPPYVSWLNQTAGAGTFSYSETNRTVTWTAGDIDANQSKIASFQVSFLPSRSQIGTTPTLIGDQRLRGTDTFTGEVVRSNRQALSTRLPEEAGYNSQVGEVQAD